MVHGRTFQSREKSQAASVGLESNTALVGRSGHSTKQIGSQLVLADPPNRSSRSVAPRHSTHHRQY